MAANVGEAIKAQLAGNSGVAALTGGRIYPRMVPQDAQLPAIGYTQVSNVPSHSHQGKSGFRQARYQINCVADTYAGAHALASTVDGCLDGFRGSLGGTVHGASVFVENVLDRSEIGPEILETAVQVDVMVYYNE